MWIVFIAIIFHDILQIMVTPYFSAGFCSFINSITVCYPSGSIYGKYSDYDLVLFFKELSLDTGNLNAF